MKQEIRVGVVCIARKTFDFQAAAEIYAGLQQQLQKIDQIGRASCRERV